METAAFKTTDVCIYVYIHIFIHTCIQDNIHTNIQKVWLTLTLCSYAYTDVFGGWVGG